MENFIAKIIYNLFILFLIIPQVISEDLCTLTNKTKADPSPSLLKCYKYNNEACCMSVHDDAIDAYINEIFSPSCVRKFPLFEILMCFGCHPNENKYINITTQPKTIRICRSFAESLWGGDLNEPTKVFDQCGFKTDFLEEGNDKANKEYLIPSQEYKNFWSFFEDVKIPFYRDYNITIQDEDNDFCYQKSKYIDNIFSIIYIALFCSMILF